MLKPSLQLKLGQQLTMTPQLQQAIRLLQMPALELQAHIRELLESNIMLEPLEETEATGVFEQLAPQAPAASPEVDHGADRDEAVPTAYQQALFDQFGQAARNQKVRETVKNVLVSAGVIIALALLLSHLMKKK